VKGCVVKGCVVWNQFYSVDLAYIMLYWRYNSWWRML